MLRLTRSVQQRTTQIIHKVYFPDETNEVLQCFKFDSLAHDLYPGVHCEILHANRLHMKSSEGFSIFVKWVRRLSACLGEISSFTWSGTLMI